MSAVCIKRFVRALVYRHGSLRKAAKATGIGHVYLHRIITGEKENPSDEVLSRLGLCRVVTYKNLLP